MITANEFETLSIEWCVQVQHLRPGVLDVPCMKHSRESFNVRSSFSRESMGVNEKLVQKGSDQPLTKVGLDDERPAPHKATQDSGNITDKVMEDQARYHEVVRT